MRSVIPSGLAAVLILVAGLSAVVPHDDLEGQIRSVSERIAEESPNAALLRARAELYRLQKNWSACFDDIEGAQQLSPQDAGLFFLQARVQADHGLWQAAADSLDCTLSDQPGNLAALELRAELFEQIGEIVNARADRQLLLAKQAKPAPEQFLALARLWRDDDAARALAVLDDGVLRLGDAPALQLEAIDLAIELGLGENALRRVDILSTYSPRAERWMALRAEVLQRTERLAEAHASYLQSLRAIDNLPARQRQSTSTRALRARVVQAIQEIQLIGTDS